MHVNFTHESNCESSKQTGYIGLGGEYNTWIQIASSLNFSLAQGPEKGISGPGYTKCTVHVCRYLYIVTASSQFTLLMPQNIGYMYATSA